MAKRDFLRRVKTASNFLAPRVVALDQPYDDENIVREASLWLAPGAVKGFDIRDFPELPASDQETLKAAVDRFTRVAQQVPPKEPVRPQHVQEALSAFRQVLEILKPYLDPGPEGRQVQDVLNSIQFPEYVRGFDFDLITDSTGDPAIWVVIIVDDAVAARPSFDREEAETIRSLVDSAMRDAGIRRWPYVSFQLASEQRLDEDHRTR